MLLGEEGVMGEHEVRMEVVLDDSDPARRGQITATCTCGWFLQRAILAGEADARRDVDLRAETHIRRDN